MTVHSADSSDTYVIPCTERPINIFRTQVIFMIGNVEFTAHQQIFPKHDRHIHIIVKQKYTEETIVDIVKINLNY